MCRHMGVSRWVCMHKGQWYHLLSVEESLSLMNQRRILHHVWQRYSKLLGTRAEHGKRCFYIAAFYLDSNTLLYNVDSSIPFTHFATQAATHSHTLRTHSVSCLGTQGLNQWPSDHVTVTLPPDPCLRTGPTGLQTKNLPWTYSGELQ